jgi:RimJ/RimL family protein N-acetyltransferase
MDIARILTPAELDLYRDHLLRLGAADRRLRFGATVGDETIEAFVARISPWDTRIIARFNDRLEVVAAVQVTVVDGPLAELAFSVDEAERGRGLGTALMRRALLWARNRGIRRLCLYCRAENHAMRRIARRAGMALAMSEGDAEGFLDVPPSTPLSIAREFCSEQAGLWDYLLTAGPRSRAQWPLAVAARLYPQM